MKHSIGFKILAILLAALALTAVVSSALVLILVSQNGLYARDLNDWKDDFRENVAFMLTEQVLHRCHQLFNGFGLNGFSQD